MGPLENCECSILLTSAQERGRPARSEAALLLWISSTASAPWHVSPAAGGCAYGIGGGASWLGLDQSQKHRGHELRHRRRERQIDLPEQMVAAVSEGGQEMPDRELIVNPLRWCFITPALV
jgi:hypothetical protein